MAPRLPGPWSELTAREIAALDPETAVAVLPVAAIEQHGPHLPVATDAILAEAILGRALARLLDGTPVLGLPLLPYGYSREHASFAGTLTLAPETVLSLWRDLGRSVARAGLRKLVLFNGHGGNPPLMDLVARELRAEASMAVVHLSWFDPGLPEGLRLPAAELRDGIHGGAVETSMMLHLAPDLVREDLIADRPSAGRVLARHEVPFGPSSGVRLAWMAEDLNPSGAVGDGTLASATLGAALVEHAVAGLARVLEHVSAYPLSRLAAPPAGREDRERPSGGS